MDSLQNSILRNWENILDINTHLVGLTNYYNDKIRNYKRSEDKKNYISFIDNTKIDDAMNDMIYIFYERLHTIKKNLKSKKKRAKKTKKAKKSKSKRRKSKQRKKRKDKDTDTESETYPWLEG